MDTFDVVIAGAGPAGSLLACSLLAANPKARVALLDRDRFPRDKACGDAIGPGVVHVLEKLGLQQVTSGFAPVEVLRVHSPSGHELAGPLPRVQGGEPLGYVIPRVVFDHRLVQAALDRGADDVTGHALSAATFSQKRWEIRAGQRNLSATILVGADGARSTVRRLLGIPYNPPSHSGIAIRRYATAQPSRARAMQLDMLRPVLPGYGWAFPVSNERWNLGVGCDVAVYKRRKLDLDRLLETYCGLLPELEGLALDRASDKTFILPYGTRLPPLHKGRAALVGDAGSMINPMTGEGIYYAAWAANTLGGLLGPALARPALLDAALRLYGKRFRKKFRRHFWENHTLKLTAASAAWSDFVIQSARRDRRILAEIIAVMLGEGALSPLLPLRVIARSF